MLALGVMFAIKNIALLKRSNVVTRFAKKNLIGQREQGLIAFNMFFTHSVLSVIVYLNIGIGYVLWLVFSAIIPSVIMIYLFVTSFKPVQRKVKGWKKSHSLGWVLLGTIVAHELIVNQHVELTTIIGITLSLGTLMIGLIVNKINKRTIKQLFLSIVGTLLLGTMILTNNLFGKAIQSIQWPDEGTSGNDATENVQPLSATTSSKVTSSSVSNSGNETSTSASAPSEASVKPSVEANKLYNDGTYVGSATGYSPNLNVSVVVKGDKILSVTVTDNNETPPFLERANLAVTSAIVANQSTSVDTVSGATRSSLGIINATEAALQTAVI